MLTPVQLGQLASIIRDNVQKYPEQPTRRKGPQEWETRMIAQVNEHSGLPSWESLTNGPEDDMLEYLIRYYTAMYPAQPTFTRSRATGTVRGPICKRKAK